MNRRTFLQASLAASMISLGARDAAAVEPPPLIVDTHQHLWDLAKLRLSWLANEKPLLNRTYHLKEYADATRGLNVKCVYMEVDVDPSQLTVEADHVVALSLKGNPTVAAVIGCRPDADEFPAYVDRFRDAPEVKGMRKVLHGEGTPPGFCLGERFVRNMRLLGERGLSFDLCMRPTELADGAKLAALCPDTRFIVDHCGNVDPKAFRRAVSNAAQPGHTVDQWKAGIDRLAAQRNVIGKISGIIARLPAEGDAADLAPIVDHCLGAFGPDRVIFGSDWPVCLNGGSLRTWVDMLGTIVASRPAAEQTKLWSANAVRFYGLKLAAG
jgi:L-fuconolactonase